MTSAARLDLRLNPDDKQRITRAAELRGVPVSAFVRAAVLGEAGRVIAEQETITFSAADGRRLLAALDKPFKPNAALRRAMERAQKLGL